MTTAAMTTDVAGSLAAWAPVLAMVALRMVGVLLVAPVFGHSAVPVKLRLAAALVLSLAVVARMPQPANVPPATPELLLCAVAELGIGILIGLSATLLFVGIQVGALQVAEQMGIALGEAISPSDRQEGGPVRALMGMLAVVIFLATGGHRALIRAVLALYDKLPAGASVHPHAMLGGVVSLLAASFTLALSVAGPVLITMLLVTVVLGLLQRVLPGCDLLTVQLPARTAIGLLAMAGSIAIVQPLLVAAVELLARQILAMT